MAGLKFSTVLLTCLAVAAFVSHACCKPTAAAPVPPDPAKLGTTDTDVPFTNPAGGPVAMDVYYPTAADTAAPTVVYIHGGGWVKGDKSKGMGAKLIPDLTERGYIVVALNYRLAPEHKYPAQIEDVSCGIRYLKANAATYGIDPERMGVLGNSAGGHLASLIATADDDAGIASSCGYDEVSPRVQAVVDFFGPVDLTVQFSGANRGVLERVWGVTDRNSDIITQASPVNHVSSDDPPFLIIHGDADDLVPLSQSEALHERLQGVGVSSTLLVVRNAAHGLNPTGGPMQPGMGEVIDQTADFFDTHLK